MATSTTVTQLPLDRYADVMRISRTHFNNLRDGDVTDACLPYWNQDALDAMAASIVEAESTMRRALGFDITPRWRTDEEIGMARGNNKRIVIPWRDALYKTHWAYVVEFGRRAFTLIEADAAIVHNLTTNVATISVATTVTDTDEIRVYYRTADGALANHDDRFWIRPLDVSISGGTATITGHPALFAELAVRDADAPSDYVAASLVDEVDVYRVYNDIETPATLLWTPLCGDPPEAFASATAACRLEDPEAGRFQVIPATYDAATGQHSVATVCRYDTPARMQIDYRAGYPLDVSGYPDPQLERTTVRLANLLAPEPPCNYCDFARQIWTNDRRLLDQAIENGEPADASALAFWYANNTARQFKLVGAGSS